MMLHGLVASCVAWRAVCCAQIGSLPRRTAELPRRDHSVLLHFCSIGVQLRF